MGMYTEMFISTDLKKETPSGVIEVLYAMCRYSEDSEALKEKPPRWRFLFSSSSYYTSNTACRSLTFDDATKQYSLIAKGDIKNYGSEIEEFFEFIAPWCDSDFIGYYRYEEDVEPTLVYSSKYIDNQGEK